MWMMPSTTSSTVNESLHFRQKGKEDTILF
jgi:hypothetical protein